MSDAEPSVLVLAPLRGDAAAVAAVVERCGLPAQVLADADALEARLGGKGAESALLVLVSHEGAGERTGEILARTFASEPGWSRLPVIFLLDDVARPPPAVRILEERAEGAPLVLQRRPVAGAVLVGLLATQAEARRRQFETRDLLERLEKAERHQAFLLTELRHRTRNSMAVLQGLFTLTARRHDSVDALVRDFSGRLQALSKAHTALTQEAGGEVALARLLREHVLPYCGREAQLRLDGPPVILDERVVFDLALLVHELATNAAKHGALSTPDGAVEVRWAIEGTGDLALVWREVGGPPVVEPTRRGLGSQIIGASPLGGEPEFAADGFVWRASIDPSQYRAEPAPRGAGEGEVRAVAARA